MSGSLAQAMSGCGGVAGRTDEIAGAPLRGDVWGCLRRFESLRRAALSPAALSAGGQVCALQQRDCGHAWRLWARGLVFCS